MIAFLFAFLSFPSFPFLSSHFSIRLPSFFQLLTSSFLPPFLPYFCFVLHVCYLWFLGFKLTLNTQSIELIYTPLIIVFMKKSKYFIQCEYFYSS